MRGRSKAAANIGYRLVCAQRIHDRCARSTAAKAWLHALAIPAKSTTLLSFTFVFYTVRVAFVHGHECTNVLSRCRCVARTYGGKLHKADEPKQLWHCNRRLCDGFRMVLRRSVSPSRAI